MPLASRNRRRENPVGAAGGDFQAAPSGAVQEAEFPLVGSVGFAKNTPKSAEAEGSPSSVGPAAHPPCRDRPGPLRLLQSPFSMWKIPKLGQSLCSWGSGLGEVSGPPRLRHGEGLGKLRQRLGGRGAVGEDLRKRGRFVGLEDVPFRKSAPGSLLSFPSPSLGGAQPSPRHLNDRN